MKHLTLSILILCTIGFGRSQTPVNPAQVGSWYMYFWSTGLGEDSPFGFQGDIQHRNWNTIGDLEQLLLRGGFTYTPSGTPVKFTLGYGHIFTGEFGDSKSTVQEGRIYQEALIKHKIGRFHLKHRYRYEQRFVENKDFRTRYRYNLFLTVPFNKPDLKKGAIYIQLYNELFINGQRTNGFFDRNRFYTAIGYAFLDNLKVQAGYMEQSSNGYSKGQTQLSLHHSF